MSRPFKNISRAYPRIPAGRQFFRNDLLDAMNGAEQYLREEFRELLSPIRAQSMIDRLPVWRIDPDRQSELSNMEICEIIGFLDPETIRLSDVGRPIRHYGTQVAELGQLYESDMDSQELRAHRVELAVLGIALLRAMVELFDGARRHVRRKPSS